MDLYKKNDDINLSLSWTQILLDFLMMNKKVINNFSNINLSLAPWTFKSEALSLVYISGLIPQFELNMTCRITSISSYPNILIVSVWS